MSIVSQAQVDRIAAEYHRAYGIRVSGISTEGWLRDTASRGPIDDLPAIARSRAHALQESLRWGAPYIFFLAPGIISWVVPLVDRRVISRRKSRRASRYSGSDTP